VRSEKGLDGEHEEKGVKGYLVELLRDPVRGSFGIERVL